MIGTKLTVYRSCWSTWQKQGCCHHIQITSSPLCSQSRNKKIEVIEYWCEEVVGCCWFCEERWSNLAWNEYFYATKAILSDANHRLGPFKGFVGIGVHECVDPECVDPQTNQVARWWPVLPAACLVCWWCWRSSLPKWSLLEEEKEIVKDSCLEPVILKSKDNLLSLVFRFEFSMLSRIHPLE
jgi:hypothetical protein